MIYKMIRRFIPLAFLATALCGLVYLAVQQSLRQGANDPQIQMAEDAAATAITPAGASGTIVDINQSLAPYLVFYDASGNPVAGNGQLDGALPNLPAGVFSYASKYGEDRFTWQPRPNIRQAVVLVAVTGGADNTGSGFVMAGRSLREVEVREDHAEFEAGMVWLFTVVGLLILEIILGLFEAQRSKK